MAIRVVRLHHTGCNDGIMCSRYVPQRLFRELVYTNKFRVGIEMLSQLWDVPVVELTLTLLLSANSTIGQCSA